MNSKTSNYKNKKQKNLNTSLANQSKLTMSATTTLSERACLSVFGRWSMIWSSIDTGREKLWEFGRRDQCNTSGSSWIICYTIDSSFWYCFLVMRALFDSFCRLPVRFVCSVGIFGQIRWHGRLQRRVAHVTAHVASSRILQASKHPHPFLQCSHPYPQQPSDSLPTTCLTHSWHTPQTTRTTPIIIDALSAVHLPLLLPKGQWEWDVGRSAAGGGPACCMTKYATCQIVPLP